MTDAGRDVVGPLVLGAWDDFLPLVEQVDLDRATRLPGWRAREVAVHLGVWDDYDALAGLVASARKGLAGADPDVEAPDVDAANARVTAAHRHASRAEVLGALARHRGALERYLTREPPALDGALTVGPVGPLPLLSVLLGEAYELAVHGLDLHAAGAPAPSARLLDAGLAALADVTGALAARSGVTGGATLQTPDGGWRFAAQDGGWTVAQVPGSRSGTRQAGTVVEGEAAVLLDASAGRGNPVLALARRRIAVHDMGGLLRLAPIVEAAPNVPGGPLLQVAARSLSGASGLLGRLHR
jgi:hypothetical protein